MPPLVSVVDSLDKVAEPLRQYYEQKGDKFHLTLEGTPHGFVSSAEHAVQLGKVVEFRDNNIRLKQEVETLTPLKTKFEGIDPEEARTAIAKVKELKIKGVDKPDDVAAMMVEAVKAATKPLTDEVAAMKAASAADRKRADDATMRSHIGEKFVKVGGVPSALDFIVGKATAAFVVEDNAVKAKPNLFSTERPGEPLSVDEWLVTQTKESDFAFKVSTGSGALNAGGPAGLVLKPGQTVLRDPTPAQLGEHAREIAQGKMKVVYTNAVNA